MTTSDTWTDEDDAAVAELVARTSPDFSQLDSWDWGIPVPPAPYVPNAVGLVVMAGMLGVLLPWAVVVGVVRWLW